MIEKYKNLKNLKNYHEGWRTYTPEELFHYILSDLEELKKLVEKKSKLTDFVNAQQPMPVEFKKVVDENFWELVEKSK